MGTLRLQFLYNPDSVSRETSAYLQRLKQIKAAEQAEVELIDVQSMSEEDRKGFYRNAVPTLFSQQHKLRVSPLVSQRGFGMKQPVLLVWQGKELKMVYPHQRPKRRKGVAGGIRDLTDVHRIEQFLRGLKPCACWKLTQ